MEQPATQPTGQAGAPKPLITFSNVQKRFKEHEVLKGISFVVYPKSVYGIIGPSGAGKTTLLRLLIGFYTPTEGQILLEGQEASKVPSETIGFATQENSFYDELTCLENLEYFGKLYNLSKAEIIQNAAANLALVGLSEFAHTPAKDLSGGMKRRLDLAISIMHQPRLLILDEPTAGLDPKLRKQVWGLIKKIRDRGITIVVTSHLLTDMEHYCDQVAIIHDGKILEAGTPFQLKTAYSKHEEIRIETAEGRYQDLFRQLQAERVPIAYSRLDEHLLIIYVPEIENTIIKVLDSIKVTGQHLLDLDVNRPALSEVFEALMNQQEQSHLKEDKRGKR